MKKLFVILFICSVAFAGSWRISLDSSQRPAFTSIQDANDAATVAAGDTLYIMGNPNSYGDVTINKKLVIIGTGYFFDENRPYGISTNVPVQINSIIFEDGSEGSVITGCYIYGGDVILREKEILVTRNYIHGGLIFESGASDETILQNYISNGTYQESTSLLVLYNTIITNNYSFGIRLGTTNNCIISNNIMSRSLECSYGVIQNNIATDEFGGFSVYLENCNVKNNMCYNGALLDYPGNFNNVDMSTVFVESDSQDGKYQLAANSPAIGAGANGEDLGMYGGSSPYVLSGIPAVPIIYYLDVPAVGTPNSGLNITVKARSNN